MISIIESHVTIMVKDLDEAIDFYKLLGIELKQRWEDHFAMMSAAGITIGLHPEDGRQTSSGSVSLGFMVKDIEEAKTLLEKHRISFHEDQGKSGHYLHFRDIDGTALYYVKPGW